MHLPIQAEPVSRKVSARKLTNIGVVPSAECCHCIPLLPVNIISFFNCMVTCCIMNPGAACCSGNLEGTGFGPGPHVGHRG